MEGSSILSIRPLVLLAIILIVACSIPTSSSAPTRRFQFNVQWKKVTRLCFTKQLLTVNGEYPGPTIAVNEGDNVEVKVTNSVARNTTLHWHGIRQMRTGWADGPAFITQCPIRGGQSYTYKFNVMGQRGTLLWHAHSSWQRASVHGAFIIYPRMPYPFKAAPLQSEISIILGEWWSIDADEVEHKMMMSGTGPDSSLAHTINGLPGPLYSCSTNDTFVQTVEYGKTYMLRIINAALGSELFFAISNHKLQVVEVDAVYTKPFMTTAIMLAPGQTMTVLMTADRVPDKTGLFPMAASPYIPSAFPGNNSTSVGFLRYSNHTGRGGGGGSLSAPDQLPRIGDTSFATKFMDSIRSLASPEYPCNVPKTIDKRVITTIGLNLQDCPSNDNCSSGFMGKRIFASMNNQSFVRPGVSILESHYKHADGRGGLQSDFPERPPSEFDYTGGDSMSQNMNANFGSKLIVVPFGTRFEIVLQDTSFLTADNHPIHVHGHNFFVVGSGFGNFDQAKDIMRYNLVDPPERNTVAVPSGGWAAIRINADNPGVWFIHCHLEHHTSWGLATGFIVQDGPGISQRLLPPPKDLPSC